MRIIVFMMQLVKNAMILRIVRALKHDALGLFCCAKKELIWDPYVYWRYGGQMFIGTANADVQRDYVVENIGHIMIQD